MARGGRLCSAASPATSWRRRAFPSSPCGRDSLSAFPHRLTHLWPGVPLALGSAVLFGLTAPLAKALLGRFDPQLLAGALYLGAGLGLAGFHLGRRAVGLPAPEAPLRRGDGPWLAAVVFFGGFLGPLLLMAGLSATGAANASLLLNLEGLATMAIAWLVFRENVDARLFAGAMAILAGAVVLSWQGRGLALDRARCWSPAPVSPGESTIISPGRLSSADPVSIAAIKGLAAGLGQCARRAGARRRAARHGFWRRGGSGGPVRGWREPCSIHSGLAAAGGGAHRGLFRPRALHRRAGLTGCPARTADRPIAGRRGADGSRPVAASRRAPRPRACP